MIQPYKLFRAEVIGLRRLSPHFLRVTVAGPDLVDFADNGYDQRFKLILPMPDAPAGQGFVHFPREDDWYPLWRALPPEQKNPVRTYTVRDARPDRREVDVDIAMHGDGGPASRWAGRAVIGAELMMVGPDRRHPGPHGGVAWSPAAGARLLIAGDETAVPAIASILERLPDGARGHALLEVPDPGDALDEIVPPDGVEVLWFFRGDAPAGTLLATGVRQLVDRVPVTGPEPDLSAGFDEDGILWDVDEVASAAAQGGCYAWVAGEAGMVADLRRFLIREAGLTRPAVASMGYWKRGVGGA